MTSNLKITSNKNCETIALKAFDGIRLEANHYRRGHKNLIVIAPGFFQSKETKVFRNISESLLSDFDVLTVDFRGHGKSGGLSALTALEPEDLRLFLDYAGKEYEKIGMIGFSLGAAISLVTAAETRCVQSLICVSAPSTFIGIDFHFWRREAFDNLMDNFSPESSGRGVRLGNPFRRKPKYIDYAERLNGIPVLFIHGTHDWLIHAKHSRKLFEKACEPKKLRIVENGLHAEKIFEQNPAEFKQWVLDWFHKTL